MFELDGVRTLWLGEECTNGKSNFFTFFGKKRQVLTLLTFGLHTASLLSECCCDRCLKSRLYEIDY